MDVFIEQLVKRKANARSISVIIGVVLMLVLLPVICFYLAFNFMAYFLYIGIFIIMFGIYLAWYFITSQRVEYEYSVAGGTLSVAKIIAKRKRKKIVNVEVKDFDLLCKASDSRLNGRRFVKHYSAAGDVKDEENTYCATFNSPAFGSCVLFFTPNEKILQAMKSHLKKDIVLELFYHRGTQNGSNR